MSSLTSQEAKIIDKNDPNYTGHRPKNLHIHYAHGKQKKLIPWEEIEQKIKDAYLGLEQRVYFVLTMYTGARKEEMLELVVDSIKYDDTTLHVDIGKRLKGSESTGPIPISRQNPYVDDIIKLHTQRSNFKPTKKLIIRFGKIYTGIKKGKDRVPVWSKVEKINRWMFLNISRSTAINIFKRVLGPEYYPHYGRLWSLSSIGRSHEGNLIMLKSRSGIKSTQVLNDYLGQSEEELEKSKDALTNIVGKAPNIPASTEPPITSS
jgi:integrase